MSELWNKIMVNWGWMFLTGHLVIDLILQTEKQIPRK